jgi:hypothetical protein
VALLTPIVKAFLTDNGWIATSHCMQVFGGHGYIHEWGMEQFVRDARINMIYEGTNTIQSLDLLGRKVLGDNGKKLKKFGKLIAAFVEEEGVREAMQEFVNPLADLGDKVTKLTTELGMKAFGNADEVGAAAVDYLRVVGHLCSPTSGPAWPRWRWTSRTGRPVLHRQAAHRALLLRQAAARDGRPDPHGARRRGAADGDGRSAVLRPPSQSRTDLRRTPACVCDEDRAAAALAVALAAARPCPGHAGGPVEDHRRRDQDREVAGAHRRAGGVLSGRIEKLLDPKPRPTRCATSAPTTARTSRSSA